MNNYYLVNTFSPMMLASLEEVNPTATVAECSLQQIRETLAEINCRNDALFISAISHEVTAKIIGQLLQFPVEFNRINVKATFGDTLLVVCPNFRANESREFTTEEIEAAGFRCFMVWIS